MTYLPLDHLFVLDLTRARAGPTATRQLGDWGADVLKVEQPPVPGEPEGVTGGRESSDFLNLHRNKRSLTLNLKEPEAVEIFLSLVERADVVVENYRADVKRRLGIDYEACRARNPRIVYGSISGFGQDGPYAWRAGVDQIAQGLGGIMSVNGLPGSGPVRVGIPIADLTAGNFLAQAILIALIERERSGEGQWVHTSLLEAQIAMLDLQATRWTIDGEVPPQAGNDHPTLMPTGVYETSDGHINIAASGGVMYARLCRAIEAEDLIDHPDYASSARRSKNRAGLNEAINQAHPDQHLRLLDPVPQRGRRPCGPIYDIPGTFDDEQVKHLGIARQAPHPERGEITVVGQPINLARTPQPDKMRLGTPSPRPTQPRSPHRPRLHRDRYRRPPQSRSDIAPALPASFLSPPAKRGEMPQAEGGSPPQRLPSHRTP